MCSGTRPASGTGGRGCRESVDGRGSAPHDLRRRSVNELSAPGSVYTVLANHIGTTGGWNTCGGSGICGPDGRLLTEAGPDRREVVTADLDPAALAAARGAEGMLRDVGRVVTGDRVRYVLGAGRP